MNKNIRLENLKMLKQGIGDLLKNDEYYKAYNKETTLKAIKIDIDNIFKEYIPKTKETTFVLEDKEYDSFSLIYALADKGIINLEHNDIETKGVEVIIWVGGLMNKEIIDILDKFKNYTQYIDNWKEKNKDYSMLEYKLNVNEMKIIEDYILNS